MENEDSETPQNQKLDPLKKIIKPDKPTARLIEEKSRLQREMITTNSAEQEMWGEDEREDTKINIFHQ